MNLKFTCGGLGCGCPADPIKQEEKVKQEELTLDDVITDYLTFIVTEVLELFSNTKSIASKRYSIDNVYNLIKYFRPSGKPYSSSELRDIAEFVRTGLVTLTTAYGYNHTGRSLDYHRNTLSYNAASIRLLLKKAKKPDNSAQIAELTAIRQNLINKVNEIQTNANFQYNIIRGVKKNLQKELLEQEEKQKRLETEFTSKQNALEQQIANISNKINKLK